MGILKKSALLALLLGGCAGSAPLTQAPDADLVSLEGEHVRASASWDRQEVVVVFMTSWCESCRNEIPRLNEVSSRHAVIAISTGDTVEEVRRVRKETGMKYPVYLDDGHVAKAFEVVGTPTIFVVDRGGAIRYRGSHVPEGM